MKSKLVSLLAAASVLAAVPAFAAPLSFDFDGIGSTASILEYYNGGLDGSGAGPGVNYGASFGGALQGFTNSPPFEYFTEDPLKATGGVMAVFGSGADARLTFAPGVSLIDEISFAYSANDAVRISVHSALGDEVGAQLLGSTNASCGDTPFCTWQLATITLSGAGQYIDFSGAFDADFGGLAGFDNLNVSAVPLPAAAWLLMSGLGAIGAMARRRKQHA